MPHFSTLTWRIIAFNAIALLVLTAGVVVVQSSGRGLVEERMTGVQEQAAIVAGALAQRPGFVKSRDSLMDAAYDDQVYVDDRTIDSHIKRLRKKFKVVADDFDAIETLYGVGYRYKE